MTQTMTPSDRSQWRVGGPGGTRMEMDTDRFRVRFFEPPGSMRSRELETLTEIAREKSVIVVTMTEK